MKRRKRLVQASLFLLAQQVIATLYAMWQHLPFEVGGMGEPNQVARDAVTRGTAISAPVSVLIVFAAFTFLASRGGKVGRVGAFGLVLLAGVFLIAGIMEPILMRSLGADQIGTREIAIVVLSAAGFSAAALVGVLGVKNVRTKAS